jgi:hypothetical protein
MKDYFVTISLIIISATLLALFGGNTTFCHTATNTLYFEATKTPVYDMEGYPANCDVELLERLEGLSDDGQPPEGSK